MKLIALFRGVLAVKCSGLACLSKDYNKMDMPPTSPMEPLKVEVSLLLLDIYKIDYHDFTMSLNLYFRLAWYDNRLLLNGTKNDYVDVSFIDNLWIPDLYIYNLKSLKMMKTITPEEGLNIVKDVDDVKLVYIFESKVDFVCPIDYSEFPFHSHTCVFQMTSFSHSSEEMEFIIDKSWRPDQVLDISKIRDYQVNVSYLNKEQTKLKSWTNDDVFFSTAGLNIRLKSRYGKYLYIYFVPSTMFTITSWVSFLLPPTNYPARTTLLVTIFLCQIGVFNAVIKETPNKDGGIIRNPNVDVKSSLLVMKHVSLHESLFNITNELYFIC